MLLEYNYCTWTRRGAGRTALTSPRRKVHKVFLAFLPENKVWPYIRFLLRSKPFPFCICISCFLVGWYPVCDIVVLRILCRSLMSPHKCTSPAIDFRNLRPHLESFTRICGEISGWFTWGSGVLQQASFNIILSCRHGYVLCIPFKVTLWRLYIRCWKSFDLGTVLQCQIAWQHTGWASSNVVDALSCIWPFLFTLEKCAGRWFLCQNNICCLFRKIAASYPSESLDYLL